MMAGNIGRVLDKSIRAKLLALTLVLGCDEAIADSKVAQKFLPARFGAGADAITAKLDCPSCRLNRPRAVAYCQARIGDTGKALRSYCFVLERDVDSYRRAAERAAARATYVPASVDGLNVEVLFSFRVSFIQESDTCSFAAIPNWGFDGTTSDVKYSAPQEIISDVGSWFERKEAEERRDHARVDTGKGRIESGGSIVAAGRTGVEFVMSVMIGTDGAPSDARLERNFFAKEYDVDHSLRAIEGSRFIPGFYEDRPMAMRYYEILYVNSGN